MEANGVEGMMSASSLKISKCCFKSLIAAGCPAADRVMVIMPTKNHQVMLLGIKNRV